MTEMLTGESGDNEDIGTRLSALARKTLAAYGENAAGMACHTSMVGAVLFRAGYYEDTEQVLSQLATTYVPNREWEMIYEYSPAYTWCFLAMTYQQLGLDDSARQWLSRARQAAEELEETDTWVIRLSLQILLTEAETELNSRQSSDVKR